MAISPAPWLALILSLPTRNATARMRVWRSLKALGCGVLRDGVYLLPENAATRAALDHESAEVRAAGGTAHVVRVEPLDEQQPLAWREMFDRTDDYARLMADLRAVKSALKLATAATLARRLAGLRRGFEDIARIDFFPGAAHGQAAALLEDTSAALQALRVPDEPRPVVRAIPRLRSENFQRRVWATRRRPWVDRLASAWLIRRFIDRQARFRWLAKPQDCPARAIGFDFDGARFTHVGNRVTFEVLLAAFGLDANPALERVARVVHYLDAGGVPVDDAAGLGRILAGARSRTRSDDALLAEAVRIFDFFYSAHEEQHADEAG